MASVAQHTPGPWIVKNRTNVVAGGEQVALTGFKMGDWPKDDFEREAANARLIAAAPDLLAVCQAISVAFAGPLGNCADKALRDAVAAALAKATAQCVSPEKTGGVA